MENNIWWTAIKLAFPTFEMADSWRNFSETVEQLRHTTEWKMIKWIKPTLRKGETQHRWEFLQQWSWHWRHS
ncbi:hypothetical protein MTR67_031969 [Solanum verrucosum]|uniref:Uncharacterized protein n=1 Tax=Solanum verrucosum TaxID=315347 RepID=A0AAF0ZIG1_SOLVR|nr:hypothetical protein MTR67_031969 [Solanum verrucosum]